MNNSTPNKKKRVRTPQQRKVQTLQRKVQRQAQKLRCNRPVHVTTTVNNNDQSLHLNPSLNIGNGARIESLYFNPVASHNASSTISTPNPVGIPEAQVAIPEAKDTTPEADKKPASMPNSKGTVQCRIGSKLATESLKISPVSTPKNAKPSANDNENTDDDSDDEEDKDKSFESDLSGDTTNTPPKDTPLFDHALIRKAFGLPPLSSPQDKDGGNDDDDDDSSTAVTVLKYLEGDSESIYSQTSSEIGKDFLAKLKAQRTARPNPLDGPRPQDDEEEIEMLNKLIDNQLEESQQDLKNAAAAYTKIAKDKARLELQLKARVRQSILTIGCACSAIDHLIENEADPQLRNVLIHSKEEIKKKAGDTLEEWKALLAPN